MPEGPANERTEQPTAKRLTKAQSKGRVPFSKELPSALTLLGLLGVLWITAPGLLDWFNQQIVQGLSCNYRILDSTGSFAAFINKQIISAAIVTAPIFLVMMITGIAGSIALSGFHYAPEALHIKWSSMNPVSGFQNLISVRTFVELLVSIAKLLFVSIIIYFYLKNKLESLAPLRWAWSFQILTAIAKLIVGLVARIGVAALIIAMADAVFQKWKYIHDLKMTRQEVKEEYREDEGPPEIKRRIRTIQLELTRKRILQEVPKASVVLVNPTHVAVALRYETETMEAPMVVAKGADYLAEKIREIARAYGVPVIRRPELARTLYATVEPGQSIPEKLFAAVAEILALIYRLKKEKLKTRK